jgi:diazepam-binding inhibitor (GABA receptor modulating acyl-CoA-binding protein)
MPSQEFEDAVAAVKTVGKDPGNDVKLKLYALYKQATEGDARGKRPGMFDLVGRAKYDAWHNLAGMAPEDAEDAYIAEVDNLVGD